VTKAKTCRSLRSLQLLFFLLLQKASFLRTEKIKPARQPAGTGF